MTDACSFHDDSEPASAATPSARRSVSLAALAARPRFIGCDDIVVDAYCDDARRCRRGDVFFARLTADDDGHDDVGRALAAGARGVVAERIVPTAGVPLCLVRSSDDALARVAHALAGDPAAALELVAVAGTNGKTTTAWLTASVLAEAGLRVGLLTDLGGADADGTFVPAADNAFPGALAAGLARLVAGGCTHAVVEVSGRMLAGRALAGIRCGTIVVPAHDGHLRRRIVATLDADGCLIAGGRLPGLLRRVGTARPAATRVVAGTAATSDVRVRTLERGLHGRTILLEAGGDVVPVAVDTPVASFARNAACAAAVGRRYGASLQAIARGIEAVGSVPGRVERIDCGQETPVFVDVASSGHGLSSTLSSLRRLTTGRLAVLVEEEATATLGRRAFSRHVRRWCDEVVTVPDEMLAEAGSPAAMAAYARVDRLLAGLGRADCLLVVGRVPAIGESRPVDAVPLAAIVGGWLRLAHPATALGRRRAA